MRARALQASKGPIVLCAMKKHIEEVFRISGFDRVPRRAIEQACSPSGCWSSGSQGYCEKGWTRLVFPNRIAWFLDCEIVYLTLHSQGYNPWGADPMDYGEEH